MQKSQLTVSANVVPYSNLRNTCMRGCFESDTVATIQRELPQCSVSQRKNDRSHQIITTFFSWKTSIALANPLALETNLLCCFFSFLFPGPAGRHKLMEKSSIMYVSPIAFTAWSDVSSGFPTLRFSCSRCFLLRRFCFSCCCYRSLLEWVARWWTSVISFSSSNLIPTSRSRSSGWFCRSAP